MITVTDEMANAFLVGQGWGCKCDTCVEAAKRGLEAALASPVGQNFAETLNFYISDSENGISYVPRQKLIEIQDAIRALSAAPAPPATGWQDISTAPKDEGELVWLWYPEANRGTEGFVYSYRDGSLGTSSSFRGMEASHWRPLPTPPNGGAE